MAFPESTKRDESVCAAGDWANERMEWDAQSKVLPYYVFVALAGNSNSPKSIGSKHA
jgi:hypothetical protein